MGSEGIDHVSAVWMHVWQDPEIVQVDLALDCTCEAWTPIMLEVALGALRMGGRQKWGETASWVSVAATGS